MLSLAVLIAAALPGLDCSATVTQGQRAEAAALFQEGQQALLASRWSEAEQPFSRAIALDPLQALAHYGLGQAYMGLGKFAEAVPAFSRSREAFRCSGPGKRAEEELRALRDAIRGFEQRRVKESGAGWRQVNRDTSTAGDSLKAIHELEQRLEDLERRRKGGDPAPLGVTLALGTAYFQSGALADAEREFREVLLADPRSGDAHNNLAVVLMLTDRLKEAEREVRLAEKAGVPVNPRLKQELQRRRKR